MTCIKKLMHIWKQAPSSSDENDTPILILWINNIFENLKNRRINLVMMNIFNNFLCYCSFLVVEIVEF